MYQAKSILGILVILVAIGLVSTISGCATFNPRPLQEVPFQERAKTETKGGLEVSVVVLSAEESEQLFGVPLANKGIQPVWVRIENKNDIGYALLETNLDQNYFSSYEAAWKSHYFASAAANAQMDQYFWKQHLPLRIPPRGTVSGFIYTNLDRGVKYVNIDLVGLHDVRNFGFLVNVPGLKTDYKQVDFDSLYAEGEIISLDEKGLRTWLENLPCCVLGGDKATPGDPLNLVVIGHRRVLFPPFVRRGWDVTETLHGGSFWSTVKSSLFGSRYRTSPVSPLYLFGRPQDIALQKARSTVDERNHLRLWLAPVKYEGMDVLVGQISRDIGVRFSWKTFVTHKIDPDVDEAKSYIFQDLLQSQSVARLGLVKGGGPASPSEPRYNYTGDPYFTDGRRAVIIMAERPTTVLDIEWLDWEPFATDLGRKLQEKTRTSPE